MIPNLSIRQLQTFREIMRSGSVSAAARVLSRTQPSVSAMLASLEAELGFDLFEREKRRLQPKPEAFFLLEEVEEILARVRRIELTMREIGDLDQGDLKIASMPGPSLFMLPKLISEFVNQRPNVDVSLMTRSSVKVHEWIASQKYDIGFAEVPPPSESIRVQPIKLHCVCALRRDDPLAKKEVLTPDDLDGMPMVALFKEHFTHARAKRIFEDAGKNFNVRFLLSIFVPALTFVEKGQAYSIIDPITAASYQLYSGPESMLTFRRFSPSLEFDFSILTPAHRPPSLLAEAFCDMLLQEVPKFVEFLG